MSTGTRHRCGWAEGDPLLRVYHDEEWGVPEYDSRALWEKLMLDGFQAGLSWLTILRKRDAFREAFKNFDPEKVARFGETEIAELLAKAGIVRSRAKIEATIRRCPGLSRHARRRRGFLHLHLGYGGRFPHPEQLRGPCKDLAFRGNLEGSEEARV